MELTKDTKNGVAYVRLKKGKVARTIEIHPGVLLDVDKAGNVLGIEVLSLAKLAPALAVTNGKKKRRSA